MIVIETSSGYYLFQPWLPREEDHHVEIARDGNVEEWIPMKDGMTWGPESLQKSVNRRARLLPPNSLPEPGFFQSLAQCLWRLQATTRGDGERFPIFMMKDADHHDGRMTYSPSDYQIVTGKTALDENHQQLEIEAFEQKHSLVTLLSRIIYGNQTGFPSGIQPYFIQIPRSAMTEGAPRTTSEKISILIEVPSFSVKVTLQTLEVTEGEHKGMEFLGVTFKSDSSLALTPEHLWVSWERIITTIPSMLKMIQKGNSFHSRVPHQEPLDPFLLQRIQAMSISPQRSLPKPTPIKGPRKGKYVYKRRRRLIQERK